jgi:alpha-L-fucosidase
MGNRKHVVRWVLGIVVLCLGAGMAQGEETVEWAYQDETPEQRNARMAWWREARFGMFIHWGVYSVPAGTYKDEQIGFIGEWIMHRAQIPIAEYKEYAKQFNPVKYDPDAWVRMARDAGMKYIVITSKHHDGFALFDTKASDWNVVQASPYGKDLLKPLAEACRRHGMKLGFYYSQAQDWTHPGGSSRDNEYWDPAQKGDMDEFIRNISIPQVRELFTNYGDVAVLWWDTAIGMTPERANMFKGLVELQPGIITNDRLLRGHHGDMRTPEQHVPATGLDYDWESCMTMNTTWGYKSYDDNWKSSKQLIHHLIDVASKGGNYLLNVGPMATGEFPPESVERLRDIGDWMEVNSSAIYGTTASPFIRLKWGRCTKKEYINSSQLYFHVFDWPEDGRLVIDGLHNEVLDAYFLADFQQHPKVERAEKGVVLQLPEEPLDPVATVIVVKIDGKLDVERIMPKQKQDGVLDLNLADVNLHVPAYGEQIKVKQDENGTDYIDNWTDYRCRIDWLVQIDQPGMFDVYAEVGVDKPTGFMLKVDKKNNPMTAKTTGGLETYETIKVGRVRLPEGECTINIFPQKQTWTQMNFRSMTLRPAEK